MQLEEERGGKARADFLEQRLTEQRAVLEEEMGQLRREKELAAARHRAAREEAREKDYQVRL